MTLKQQIPLTLTDHEKKGKRTKGCCSSRLSTSLSSSSSGGGGTKGGK